MKFQLINKTSGLIFGQHKVKFPLNIYRGGTIYSENDFKEVKCTPLIRSDGAIAFQRHNPWYDEGELYFLNRDEWEIKIRENKEHEKV